MDEFRAERLRSGNASVSLILFYLVLERRLEKLKDVYLYTSIYSIDVEVFIQKSLPPKFNPFLLKC